MVVIADTEAENVKTEEVARPPSKEVTPTPLSRQKTPVNNANTENLNTNIILGTTEHDMELKYLTFVSDITREILTSSVSSDRALNMLFERHVALNKGKLNESIMRMRIEELKIKLSITS